MRRPNRLTGDVPPPPALICDGGGTVPPDILAVELDDATAAYVCAVQPAFDLLRQAAGQLAGLLVLSVACARDAGAHPMLELACEAEAEARDAIRAVGISLLLQAAHHHSHMLSANRSLTAALASAKRTSTAAMIALSTRSLFRFGAPIANCSTQHSLCLVSRSSRFRKDAASRMRTPRVERRADN